MADMSTTSEKTTIYLNPMVKKFIKHKAVEEDSSISEVINDYFADMLEDLDDIKDVEARRGESTVSFDEVLGRAGLTYEDLRS